MTYTPQPDVEHKKLTEWKNEPDIKKLKQDFLSAQAYQTDHIAKINNWTHLRDITGPAKPAKIRGRSSVQPKLIRRQNEWRYSALTEPFLSSEKMFKVSPTTWEDHEAAKQNELVLNWQFRTQLNSVKFIDEFVRTTVDEGTSIIRLGWERETRKVKKKVPVYNYSKVESEEEAIALEEALIQKREDFNNYLNNSDLVQKAVDYFEENGVPVIARDTGKLETIEEDKVIRNRPTIQIMNPKNVFIDPSCEGDIDKARFVIVSFETSRAELKRDKRYKNLDAVNFDGAGVLAAPDHETNTPSGYQFEDTARKRIVAYEYWGLWDVEGNDILVPIVATWVGDTLVRLEKNPFPDEKPPFVLVPYLPVKRSVYGETDAELLEDQQKILGAVYRGMIDIMARSANGQKGTAKGMLDGINKRRFDAGMDYEFNPDKDPRNQLIEHTYPEIPQSALTMVTLQNQEAEALTGVKAFSGGMSGNAYGDVAAGIRGLLDAASKREMAILRRLAKGIKDIGSKIVMMNQEFMAEEEVIRITNEEFKTVRREDLAGYFDLEVDISTAEVDNAKAQDLAFMLQTIGPDMDLDQRNLILSEIAELKRMPKLAKQLRDFQPKPNPLDEALKEMEVQKMQKEIEKLDSEILLNQARARQAESVADRNDLEFVEQESGTKHARDLEKQGAQADANKELEVTKALLKPKKEGEKEGNLDQAVGYNEITRGKPREFAGSNYAPEPPAPIAGRPFDSAGRPNPKLNIGSKYYDSKSDPTMNQAMNLGR